ncbi:PAAR-like domain-containing protein [Rhizobium leguminosarum]|uniref:PAAR-like domain-containing protein n=1 Tax=Rhizobium leguminosarum TaxID=384 RepID=UPI000DE3EB99
MSIPRDNYVGEPDYPAPWTTKQPREGLRDLDEAKIVSLSPDVCLTPVGSSVVPIPYPIVDYCGHDMGYTPSVLFTGKKAMVMRSRTTHVHGDAPGTRKGVKSGTVENVCEPIEHADQVRAESSHVIRHLDRFWMNNRNTQGEAIFVRGTETYAPPKDDDPVRGSLRANGSDEGRVVSDASPEPLIMGAQYAQANVGTMTGVGGGVPVGGTTRGATTTAPPTTQTPTAGSQIGSQVLKRLGIWGRAASLVLDDLSKTQAEKGAEARAFQTILSGPGDYVMTQNRLLGGRQHVSNPLDMFNSSAWEGKYGLIINDSERVPLANDILSTLAGKPMDVRTMSDAEVQSVLSPFQGLSEDQIEQKLKEMTEARKKEEEEEKPKPEEPTPVPILPDSTVRIDEDYSRRCPIKTISFESHGKRDEFERQVEEQEGRLNRMPVSEYMQRRAPILPGVPGRQQTLASRRAASLPYQNTARNVYIRNNQTAYVAQYGRKAWQDHLSSLAATHELDLIAGGYENEISGMGGAVENSSIGPQWRADSRSGALDRHAQELARNGCPMMRVNLVVN